MAPLRQLPPAAASCSGPFLLPPTAMSWKHEREESRNRCCTYGLREVKIKGDWYLADGMGAVITRDEYFNVLRLLMSYMEFYADASDGQISLANAMKGCNTGVSQGRRSATLVVLHAPLL